MTDFGNEFISRENAVIFEFYPQNKSTDLEIVDTYGREVIRGKIFQIQMLIFEIFIFDFHLWE